MAAEEKLKELCREIEVEDEKCLPEKCEFKHCFLPKGHNGLHKVAARIYDLKKCENGETKLT